MADRTIESIHDITERDVRAVYHSLELVRALTEFSEGKEDHKGNFNETALRRNEQALNGLWQSLSVVVAAKKEREIDPIDLMDDMASEGEPYE